MSGQTIETTTLETQQSIAHFAEKNQNDDMKDYDNDEEDICENISSLPQNNQFSSIDNQSGKLKRLMSDGTKCFFDSKFSNKDFNLSTYEERKQFRLIEILTKEPNWRKTEEIDWVIQQTQEIQFFQNLINQGNQDIHRRCCQKMKYEYYPANSLIFKIGTYGNKFFIIIDGKVGVYIRNIIDYSKKNESKTLIEQGDQKFDLVGGLNYFKELSIGMSFGELALLERKPRAASILCHTKLKSVYNINKDVHLAVLMKEDFDSILKNYEEYKLYQAAQFFDQVPPFSKWNQRRQINLHLNANRQIYKINQVVYEEGQDPNAIYIIKSGTFAVMKQKINNPKKIEKAKEDPEYAKQQIIQQDLFNQNQNQVITLPQQVQNKPITKKVNQTPQTAVRKKLSKGKRRPKSQVNSKSGTNNNSLLNLSPAQFQKYLTQKRQELNNKESSEEEDEQDVLLKKHDLFGVKSKDAKYQKPIQVKIAEVGQFSYFGEEEIVLRCKKRVFSVICTSAYGEVLQINRRDFELRVLTDTISRNYIKEQEKLSQQQIEKTLNNRDIDAVKDFLIGVDYIEEVADNQLKKRHFHQRIAKNEINVDDLINGSFIKSEKQISPRSQMNELNAENEMSQQQIIDSTVFGQDKSLINNPNQTQLFLNQNSVIHPARKSNQIVNISTLFPSSARSDNSVPLNNQSSMYQSKRINTPDRLSISVQKEFQITEDLMHQTIQEKVKEKLDKIKMEESIINKTSAFRQSSLLDQKLKKYKQNDGQIQSQPTSPANSERSKLNNMSGSNSPQNNQKNTNENKQDQFENNLFKNRSKGGFWNVTKNVMEANNILQDQNLVTAQLPSEQNQKKSPKQTKKEWVDSYTISFQENLKKNLQEKFKDTKINVDRIKQHLKQKAINMIPNQEFHNIPDSILQKPQVVVPVMDEKIKLFKRVIMKSLGTSKSNSNSTLIQELQDKIKQKHVLSIRDGFISTLQKGLHTPNSQDQQNDIEIKNLTNFPSSTKSTGEQFQLSTPFSRSTSIRGHNLIQSSVNLNNYQNTNFSVASQSSRFNTVASSAQSFRQDMNQINTISSNRRLNTTNDRKYSLHFKNAIPPSSPTSAFLSPKQNSSDKINFSHQKSNSFAIKSNNSPKGYSFYEHKSKQLYNQRMKSKSINYHNYVLCKYPSNNSENIKIQQTEQQNFDSKSSSILLNEQKKDDVIQTKVEEIEKIPQSNQEYQNDIQDQNKESTNLPFEETNSNLNNTNYNRFQPTLHRPFFSNQLQQNGSRNTLSINTFNQPPLQSQKAQAQLEEQSIKFPSNDTVKEEVSIKEDSQKIELNIQNSLDEKEQKDENDSPKIFSPVFSPIPSSEKNQSAQNRLLGLFAPRSQSIFKSSQINPLTIQSEQNLKKFQVQNEMQQKNNTEDINFDHNEKEGIEDYFGNTEELNSLRKMDFRFRLSELERQQSNQNESQHENLYQVPSKVQKVESQSIYKNRQNSLSQQENSPQNSYNLLGRSVIKKQQDSEQEQMLIQKHIQHKRFFSLMTDQYDGDYHNLNLEELKKNFKYQEQNPFFLAQSIDISQTQSSQMGKKISTQYAQQIEKPFQFEGELKQQQDQLLMQMNKIQQAEKQIHSLKPKTNTILLQSKEAQQLTLENIMNMQKNMHKRSKTEIPLKLSTKSKQANSPIYKFQVEKLYSDKIRQMKTQQQNDEISRKNDFFNRISMQTQSFKQQQQQQQQQS